MTSTLHHVALTASNLTKSAEFYDAVLGVLGYKHAHTSDRLCVWVGQQPEVLVYAVEDENTSPHVKGRPGLQHLAIEVADQQTVETVYDQALAGGWTVVFPPKLYPDYAEDYFAVFIEDPDGSRWEFFTMPNRAD